MTAFLTPEEAAKLDCPVARIKGDGTKGDGTKGKCQGEACILWRKKSVLDSNPLFISAVQREMSNLATDLDDGKNPMKYHKQAVKNVAADPTGYGVLENRGYCGIGGKP